jgi:hypothetical protein
MYPDRYNPNRGPLFLLRRLSYKSESLPERAEFAAWMVVAIG